MADLPPNGFQIGDLYCFPQGPSDAATFAYIPGPPHIELQAGGQPAVGLVQDEPISVLSIQTVWTAEPETLASAAQGIRERYPDVSSPRLTMAELTDVTATLTVTTTNGSKHTFAQPTSGPETHRAALSERLSGDQREAATAALGGTSDRLTVAYRAQLISHASAAVTISGDLADDLRALAPKPPEPKKGGWFARSSQPTPPPVPPDPAACAARVDSALAEGRLTLATTASSNASTALRARAEQAVRTSVARYLFEQLEALGPDAQYMSSLAVRKAESGVEDLKYSIERTLDVGAWFAGYRGPSVMTSTVK